MEMCMLRNVLVAVFLVAVAGSASPAQKLAYCCTSVSTQEITDPILGYLVQKRNPPCVQAVIFQTEKGLFCSHVKAPWVHRKIVEFRQASINASTPSEISPTSRSTLLSIITSSSSPPPSSISSSAGQ